MLDGTRPPLGREPPRSANNGESFGTVYREERPLLPLEKLLLLPEKLAPLPRERLLPAPDKLPPPPLEKLPLPEKPFIKPWMIDRAEGNRGGPAGLGLS